MKNLDRLAAIFKQSTFNAKNNTDEQALNVKTLYKKWVDIPVGTYLEEGMFTLYKNVLYKVRDGKGHNKDASWNPEVAVSEFVRVQMEEIKEWLPYPEVEGYDLGDLVSHNEFVWESLFSEGKNVWEPSDAVPTLWRKLRPL